SGENWPLRSSASVLTTTRGLRSLASRACGQERRRQTEKVDPEALIPFSAPLDIHTAACAYQRCILSVLGSGDLKFGSPSNNGYPGKPSFAAFRPRFQVQSGTGPVIPASPPARPRLFLLSFEPCLQQISFNANWLWRQ